MKALIGPAFSRENVRNMGPIFYQVASRLQDHLASLLQSTKSIELNAFDLTGPAALDLIGKAAFGYDFKAIEQGPDAVRIMETWRHQNETGVTEDGFKGIMALQLLPWITYLPLKAIKAQAAVVNHIREFAKQIVDSGEIDPNGGKDLMSLLRELRIYRPLLHSDSSSFGKPERKSRKASRYGGNIQSCRHFCRCGT